MHGFFICTGMGYFSNKLSEVVERHGSAQALADLTTLSRSTISRFVNDKMLPDKDSLRLLCTVLTEDEAGEIIDAYALDLIPENLRYLIRIERTSNRVREDEPLPDIFARLKPDTRATIKEIARLSLEDEELAETFQRLVKALSPQWAQARSLAQVTELGNAIKDRKS